MKQKRKIFTVLFFILALVFNLFIASVVVYLTDKSANMIIGSDTMYHVYRGQWLLDEIKKGNFYPIYNPIWYNGVELMRYWTPAAAYLMAFCQVIAGFVGRIGFYSLQGNIGAQGFAVYAGMIYFIGAMNWCFIGIKRDRKLLSLVIGLIYFFVPTGIYLFYGEGNLPRSLIISILPLFLHYFSRFYENRKRRNLIGVAVTFAMMVLCHVGYAGMIAISVLIYFIVKLIVTYAMERAEFKNVLSKSLTLLFAVIIGFMLTGIFLIPALKGGMASNSGATSQVAVLFFQPLLKSLNPVAKFHEGYAYNYFGLSLFIVAVFGALGSRREQKTEFITALIIFLMTAQSMSIVLINLPGGQFLWMLRFLPIVSALILFGLFKWKTLKKWIMVLLCLFIVADSIPMLSIYKTGLCGSNVKDTNEYFENIAKETILDKAKRMTKNRLAYFDSSAGVYYLTGYGEGVNQIFGQGWEASSTSRQITEANEAYDTGEYYFMFDRLVELGVDTIVVNKNTPSVSKYKPVKVERAAKASGYSMVEENAVYAFFKLDRAKGTFGVVSEFQGLAVGEGAYYICRMFPNIETAEEDYLDDYSVSDFEKYSKVYLFKFKFHNIDKAEQVVKQAAKRGVEFYIMADGVPVNPHTQTEKFLGVEMQKIQFENAFPMIHTKDHGDFVTKLFPTDLSDWRTVYLNGLDDTEAYIKVLDRTLSVVGTKGNDNIHFIGLNLTYFYSQTRDRHVAELLENILDVSTSDLPERKVVPVEIKVHPRSIEILSEEDHVNTTIATHDIFEGDFYVKNRMVYVHRGKTLIKMHYPYLLQGCLLSIGGLVLLIILAFQPFYRMRMKHSGKSEAGGGDF